MYLEQLYSEIYLTFPDGIASRQRFCDLYIHIINHIPAPFAVNLFVTDVERFRREFEPRLTRAVATHEASFSDIWLGDYFPFRFFEGAFTFDYAENQHDQELLLEFLGEEAIDEVPLQLDLGSFEMIDDVLIVSEDVYENNCEGEDRSEVDEILAEYFEHSELIVCQPGTRLNHIDTLFRVFDNIVLYNSTYVPPETLERVKSSLSGKGHEFYDLPFELSGEVNDYDEDFIESYVGNAFDFIVLGNTILFPVVTDQDRKSLNTLKHILEVEKNEKEVIVLEHRDLEALYSLGGGLFCISGIY